MEVLGIDIGGSGIKGAPVNIETGELLTERLRIPTPQPATPKKIANVIAELAYNFSWTGPIGCGFPAVIRGGIAHTAANVDNGWIGTEIEVLFSNATGCKCSVGNDADVAGMAEIKFGAGRDQKGTVLIITLGTGIGTALFIEGKLMPNTELGHIELNGRDAETWAADSARSREDLSWKKWAKRLNLFLMSLEAYLWPDLIIVGGGVSKKHEKFLPLLSLKTDIVPAIMRNEAGIIGAALKGAESLNKERV